MKSPRIAITVLILLACAVGYSFHNNPKPKGTYIYFTVTAPIPAGPYVLYKSATESYLQSCYGAIGRDAEICDDAYAESLK